MTSRGTAWLCVAGAGAAASAVWAAQVGAQPRLRAIAAAQATREHALRVVTINTGAYPVEGTDRRSEKIVATEDMHIVSLSHFIGVQSGIIPSDNGHVLSTNAENPWTKWQKAGTGMEPTGTFGYFGYAGRDYYAECSGIGDVCWQESMPAGCHMLVRKGETLYMHCYASHGLGRAMFHHAVRAYYW